MEDKVKVIYEYCVLRYVSDVEREEFLNVGLIMMSKRYRWMRCALHVDEQRIRHVFPNADIERLRLQLAVFIRDDVPQPDLSVEERYRWMAAVKSAIIQTSPSHPGILTHTPDATRADICCSLDSKFDELFHRLVR